MNADKRLCEAFYSVVVDADAIITHNGRKFDLPYYQSRLIYHGLPPLPKIHHVDTCAESKRNLFVLNNRLQTLARWLTDKEKMRHEGWDLWVKTHRRDQKSMDTMNEYCRQDVLVLEEIFRRIKPIVASLPNYNLFNPMKAMVCPKCGSTRIHQRGIATTKTKRYRRYQCQDCGGWGQADAKDEVLK